MTENTKGAREALNQHLETCDRCLQYPPVSCWVAWALFAHWRDLA